MSEPTVTPPAGGEVIGDSAERRVEILSDGDAMHATWSRFGPGREGADPHIHRLHSDLFYVLAGELTVRLGLEDELVAVPKGALARVPPLVVHGFRNASDAELRYLNFHAPGVGFADYMRGLRDGRRAPRASASTCSRASWCSRSATGSCGRPRGSWVEMPAGVPHVLSSQEPARYLSVLTPWPG